MTQNCYSPVTNYHFHYGKSEKRLHCLHLFARNNVEDICCAVYHFVKKSLKMSKLHSTTVIVKKAGRLLFSFYINYFTEMSQLHRFIVL